jgi:hypothetical protein
MRAALAVLSLVVLLSTADAAPRFTCSQVIEKYEAYGALLETLARWKGATEAEIAYGKRCVERHLRKKQSVSTY